MKYDSFQITMLVKEIYSSTTNIISNNLKDSGLTHQQVMVIKLIAHKGEVNVSQLCEEMSLAKGTVSGIVQRLENMGYVKKRKDEEDKRNTYITFTEEGLSFAKDFRVKINESFDKVYSKFTEEELEEIKNSLLKLKNKIKEVE